MSFFSKLFGGNNGVSTTARLHEIEEELKAINNKFSVKTEAEKREKYARLIKERNKLLKKHGVMPPSETPAP